MDIKDIQTILQMLKQNDVHEFELDHDGTRIKLSRAGQLVASPIVHPHAAVPIQPAIVGTPNGQPANNDAKAAALDASLKKVESPIVGTFYRKPSPDAPAFVKEGDRIKKGATLCIIEAMKVMNEIDAPCDGIIEKVLPSDGEVVEFGEVLFLINP